VSVEDRFWVWWSAELRGIVAEGYRGWSMQRAWTPAEAIDAARKNLRSWRESWAQQVRAGRAVTLHSKTPKAAPDGYVRLAYYDWSGPVAQGPNFIYIKPEWAVQVLDLYITWHGSEHAGPGGRSMATVQPESIAALADAAKAGTYRGRGMQPTLL
jgi:hypothetical protein